MPLKAPHSGPVASVSGIAAGSGTPAWTSTPKTTLVSARMLATERSISRAMIRSTIGSTISARSDTPAIACEMLKALVKLGTKRRHRRCTASVRTARNVSQLAERAEQVAHHRALAGQAAPRPRDEGVDADGDQDDQAVDALQPERIDAHQGQPVLDDQQRERAERDAEHRAGAAADGDAADHDRGDHRQLEAERDAGIDGGIARGPQRTVEAGEQARRWRRRRARGGRRGCRSAAAPSGLEPMA